MIRGLEFIGGGQPEGSCPLRISKALVMRSSSAVRVTRAEHSRRFLSSIIVYKICYNLSPGDSSEN